MRRCLSLLALLVSALAGAQETGIGDPTFPTLGNKGYKASHYLLKLNYDPATNFLKGDVTMDATTTNDLTSLSMDFKGFEITSVKLNGKSATYARSPNKLRVNLGQSTPSGTKISIETIYSGKPQQDQTNALPQGIKSGWISYKGGSVAVCEPDLAHTWFPCNDHPLNKATFEVDVTVPGPYTPISNGVGSFTGEHTMRFVLDKPAMTCMATLAVGQYAMFKQVGPNGLPITNYLPLGAETKYIQPLSIVPKFIQYLSDHLGPYPFASYGTIMLPKDIGNVSELMKDTAIETTTIPVFGPDSSTDPAVLVHELTHQWMGDCVSITNWGDDIWWVEGFAQYSEWLLTEFQQGKGAYNKQVKAVYSQVAQQPHWLKPGHLTAPEMFVSGQSYIGGGLLFYALRATVGDDKFFQIVKGFVAKNRYGNATAADWIEVATQVTGKDMKPFFDEWLYSDKVPKLPN